MSKIIYVEIKDGLLLSSGFLAPADYLCILYLRVPEAWLSGGDLVAPQKEVLLEILYGKGWREGNEDGSRYHVMGMDTVVLSDEEVASGVWLHHNPADRSYQYWYYHVTDDGQIQKSEQATFNQ